MGYGAYAELTYGVFVEDWEKNWETIEELCNELKLDYAPMGDSRSGFYSAIVGGFKLEGDEWEAKKVSPPHFTKDTSELEVRLKKFCEAMKIEPEFAWYLSAYVG